VAIIDTGLLTKGLRSEFFNRFEAAPAHYRQFATRVASSGHSEVYRWLGSTPQMREWGDGRLARGLRSESYSLENLKYEATLEVDRDEIADDQTGQIRVRVGELAERAATHKDYLIAQLLGSGDQAGFHSYDGVPFFSANHVSGDSGVQSNVVSSGASGPSSPTATEFRGALAEAITRILSLKDDRGEPMALTAQGLFAVVPPSMLFAALEAVSGTVANGATNVLSAVAPVISFPWLESTDKWYLLKTDGVVRPFIFQDREPIEFTALVEDSEDGFKREKFLYGVRARYRMAYGYWQFAVQSTFEVS
jgi:phage major head subunit gpT-like protein